VQQLPTPENDEVSTRYLWDTPGTRDGFAGFDNGGVDTMDYSIPTSSENANDSRHTSPELEHFISRMWQPNFENLSTGCLPDVVLNSQGAYMHCSNMAYGTSGIHDQHELQLPRIRVDPGLALPIPGTVAMPQQTLPVSYPERMSNASIDTLGSPRSTSGHRAVPGNKSPHPSPHESPAELFAHHGQPVASSSSRNLVGLETRFEHVIKAVEECGFKSIDDMSAQYYTAAFKEDTAPFWAQSRSRSRSLPGLLASLHDSTKTWTTRDIQNYKQQVANMAEDIYVGELSTAKQNIRNEKEMWNRQETMSTAEQSDRIVENLWAAISDIEHSPELKQKKTMIRESVSIAIYSETLTPEANAIPNTDARTLVTLG
jgi:hypothetical protein